MNSSKPKVEKIIDHMRESGYRMTPQRLAIIEILINSHNHPCAEQIFAQVRQDFPMTSLATVYKTISVLLEMGEILELGYSKNSSRYDSTPHPHPHLVCVRCNSIIDAEIDLHGINDLTPTMARQTGYQIVSHQLDFFGICPSCQKAGKSKAKTAHDWQTKDQTLPANAENKIYITEK